VSSRLDWYTVRLSVSGLLETEASQTVRYLKDELKMRQHLRNPQVSWDKRTRRALVQVDAEGLNPEMVGNQIAEELLEAVSAIVVTQIENLHVDVLNVAQSQN
jgi:hypothetical protein